MPKTIDGNYRCLDALRQRIRQGSLAGAIEFRRLPETAVLGFLETSFHFVPVISGITCSPSSICLLGRLPIPEPQATTTTERPIQIYLLRGLHRAVYEVRLLFRANHERRATH